MNIFVLFCCLLSIIGASGIASAEFNVPPETVSSFNASAYKGRWFQMYTSLIPTLTYEKDGFCVYADYSEPYVTSNRTSFAITNSLNKDSPTGKLEQATGHLINEKCWDEPGKFKLTFDDVEFPPAAFYWIVRLGDIEADKTQYPWAIVSVPFQTSLFILARDVDEFRANYKESVLHLVEELGFTYFFNKPIETYHSSECAYA